METTEEEWNLQEVTELGEEVVRYADTLKIEEKTKENIARYVNEIQKAMSKPVELDPKRLARWFPNADSASLVEGENLVLKRGKKEVQVSVLKLDPEPYMAVVREAASTVARLIADD
jgi:hypothetical protein